MEGFAQGDSAGESQSRTGSQASQAIAAQEAQLVPTAQWGDEATGLWARLVAGTS